MTTVLMKSTRNKFVQDNVIHYSGVWVLFSIEWKEGICFIQEKRAIPCYSEGILLITSELGSEFSYRLPVIPRKLGNKQAQMHDFKPV